MADNGRLRKAQNEMKAWSGLPWRVLSNEVLGIAVLFLFGQAYQCARTFDIVCARYATALNPCATTARN